MNSLVTNLLSSALGSNQSLNTVKSAELIQPNIPMYRDLNSLLNVINIALLILIILLFIVTIYTTYLNAINSPDDIFVRKNNIIFNDLIGNNRLMTIIVLSILYLLLPDIIILIYTISNIINTVIIPSTEKGATNAIVDTLKNLLK